MDENSLPDMASITKFAEELRNTDTEKPKGLSLGFYPPHKNVDELEPFRHIDQFAKSLGGQEEADKMREAYRWANNQLGNEKELGGWRVRDVANAVPFGASVIDAVANNRLKYKDAKEAYEKGNATDEQLGIIAKQQLLDDRQNNFSFGRRVANAAVSTPAVLGEAYLGGGIVRGAAGAIGAGRLVGGAATGLGRIAQNAGTMAAATPLMPSTYFEKSVRRSEQNGGNWYDPQNVAPALLHAGVTNALLGQIQQMTGGLPGGLATRMAVGGAAMPVEQAGADAFVTGIDKAMEKAGIDKKWQTDTKFGTIGMIADGRYGEGLQELALQSMIGAGMSAFHGKEQPYVEKFAKAVDSLAEKGVSPEKAAEVIKQAIAEPKPPEGEKAPETPKPELQTKQVDDFASLLDEVPQISNLLKSNNVEKPAGPETAKNAPQTADLEKPATEPVQQPIAPPAKKPATGMGYRRPTMDEIMGMKNAQEREGGNSFGSDLPLAMKQSIEARKETAKPKDMRHNPDLDEFFASPAAKEVVKESPKDLRHNPDLDAIFAEPPKAEAKQLPKEWVRPANDLLDEFMAIPTEKPKPVATLGPKQGEIQLGQPMPDKKSNGQELTRMPILEGGKEIGEFKGFQSGGTLHIEWLGATGAGAGDKWAKGLLGPTRMKEIFFKLAKAYPDAIAMKYTPAEKRLNAGKTKWIDLEKLRESKLTPEEREAKDAIHDAIRSGESQSAIAEAIQAGNAAAETNQGSNGQTGERQPAAQTEPASPATQEGGPAQSGPDRSAGRTEPARGMERLGHETEISVAGSHPIPARYELRELKDIVASHGITEGGNFRNREGEYPAGLQPRDYSGDITEQDKVRRYAQEMNPAQFINDDPNPTGGPTTITQNGNIAINGNGRQLALEEAARIGKYPKYKAYLEKKASNFGLDPAQVAKMDQPVLVRVVNMEPGGSAAAEFARRGNVSTTQGQSPARTAASLAPLIDKATIDSLKLEGDTTFAEAVSDPRKGAEFRKRVADSLPPSERNKYFTEDGMLTDSGKELVRNMLLSKILPIETIERMKDEMKSEARTIEGAIPQLLQLTKNDAIDPRKPLAEAIDVLSRNPRIKTISDADNALSQKSLFGGNAESISPAGRMMLDFIIKDGQKPLVFRKKLGNVITDVSQATKGLFADEPGKFDPVESVARNLGVEQRSGAKFETGESAAPEGSKLRQLADRFNADADKTLKPYLKGEKLLSNVDPEIAEALAKKIAAKLIHGALDFKDFAKAMIAKFGEAIRPHLQPIWDRANAYAEELRNGQNQPSPGKKPSNSPGNAHPPYDTVSPLKTSFEGQIPPDVTGIRNAITEKERAARGLLPSMETNPVGHSFPELADRVATIARSDPQRIPDLVRSLLEKPRNVTDLEDAMLLHRQVELQNQYDRIAETRKTAQTAGDAAGVAESENALAATRKDLRDLYDVNRKVGTESGRALNARKMLMAKDYSLAKMTTDYELSVGRKMNANDMAVVQKAHERIKELEQRIADLQKKAEVKPEPKQPTFGKRTEAAKAEVDAAWEALRKATKGKLFSNPAFDPEVINAAAGVAKAYIKLGVAKFSDFVEAVQQKSGHQASEEEKKILQAAWDKAQSENPPTAKPEPPKTQTKEQRQVDAEYRSAVTGWAEQLHKNRQANDTSVAKGIRHAGNLTDFLRSIMLGGDLPPIFRQGLVATLQHPLVSTKAFFTSAKAFKSETSAHEVLSDLALRPNARNGMYQRHLGMDVTNIHGLDEFLHSSWIKRVPGFAHLERWHSAYLSKLRADLFDLGEAALSRAGKFTEAEADIIGNNINVATGKGELYGAERIVNGLNKVFLAPRWVASRFEFALGQPLLHGIREHGLQPRARAYVAKEYARAMGGMAFVYGIGGMLVAQGLATIDKNPLAADFGDIRIGNTRINPTASLSNAWRFMTRMWEAKKSAKDTANPNNRKEIAMSELRSKLAPIPANAWTAMEIRDKETGKTKKGPQPWHPQNWKDFAIDAVAPLSIQDTIKACNDLGLPKGLVVGLLASLGANVKVYGK